MTPDPDSAFLSEFGSRRVQTNKVSVTLKRCFSERRGMGSGRRPYGAPRGLHWEAGLYNVMAGGAIKKALIVKSKPLVSMYANIWMYGGERLKRGKKIKRTVAQRDSEEKEKPPQSNGTQERKTHTHLLRDRCFRQQETKAVIVEKVGLFS